MHLDSCRELKRSVLTRLPDLGLRPEAAAPWLALGVTRRDAGAYSLAVRVPETGPLGEVLGRITEEARQEVDVRGVGRIEPVQTAGDLQRRRRPLVPGCSIAHPDVTAGTLGGFVTVDGVPHVLSNNHVLADSDRGAAGDGILQPGPADGGQSPQDRIGSLAAAVELVTDRGNLVDAAVARLDDGVATEIAAYPGGHLCEPVSGPPDGDAVEKVGRTTGHTTGRITAFEMDGLRISYPEGELVFDDQIEIAGDSGPFSRGGDSGSVIWTREGRNPVGLLFAGSTQGGPDGTGLTYANVLTTALQQLGATWLQRS
ncbi:hypothetical protein DFQ14_10296 [Halopolyspora algeriensis]|uniref:Nal1 C-terminal domain-containing protein n=1 Tax=Halopolyspora algeriensis TaxID=1500506 RepID=A0A368VV75_9ACTN|nr:hypothetical protein [Halopolyspora algeriensis]RCW45795.1 hypothetical protein DFQ14_10296 [Halopolyspora algeriensis]TQM54179.1 hypothetical protein FHU43_2358 [Halopolyspora algeriensis]